MTFSVYVGPYVKAYGTRNGNERELMESFDDILQEGRGECGIDRDGATYVIPNEESLGLTFSEDESDDPPVAFLEKTMRRDIEMMGSCFGVLSARCIEGE